jgi:hypothetical protein
MALVFADKVKVRSFSTGSGTIVLETVFPGFQSFSAIGIGNECYYGIEDAAGNWEVGQGTYDTDSTVELLSRDIVISSSNANNAVNFPPGGKSVFVTIPSSVAANIIASTTFAFRDIAVATQPTVSAESTSDTLTLVAGTGISITTDATSDTITIAGGANDRLVNGVNEVVLGADGSLSYPNNALQTTTTGVLCEVNVSTIIYTGPRSNLHTIKLLVQAEGNESAGSSDTQSCEIIVAKSIRGDDVAATVYAIVHTSVSPLATFTAEWNVALSRVQVLCTPTSTTYALLVRTFATEIQTSD